ncbi:MAG TPA: LUD domain-containing protein, partial [bacterium]|nr:LUD domain-containing protein [bacterium]
MVSSFCGKFESSAKLNGVNVAHCITTSDVVQYLLRLAHRNGTDRFLSVPPPFAEEKIILEGLRREGMKCFQEDIRKWILQPCFGLTGAVSGIADTGALLLNVANESTRLVSS